jgi:hypothetical protein
LDEKRRRRKRGELEIGPLGKDKGKIVKSLEEGNMVAVLSGMEIMYIFLLNKQYHCFIHKMDAEEGRRKSYPVNERNTAMLDGLHSAADALFEVVYEEDMDKMGVMVTAEKAIIGYLDMTGNLPAEDMDYMDWLDPDNGPAQENTEEKKA